MDSSNESILLKTLRNMKGEKDHPKPESMINFGKPSIKDSEVYYVDASSARNDIIMDRIRGNNNSRK